MDEFNRALRRKETHMASDAYRRHQRLLSHYYGSKSSAPTSTASNTKPYGFLQKHHKFIRTAEDDADLAKDWEKRVAKKYYDQLFKEYALIHLGKFKEHQIALRWRTEKEVVQGKGQFCCGALDCQQDEDLFSWEVPFRYKEDKIYKEALVKVRLCPLCSEKLHVAQKKDKKASAKRRKTDQEEEQKQNEVDEVQKKDEDHDVEEDRRRKEASKVWSQPIPDEGPDEHKPYAGDKAKIEEFDAFFQSLFQ